MGRSIALSGEALASAQHEPCRAGARGGSGALGQRLRGIARGTSGLLLLGCPAVAAPGAPIGTLVLARQSFPIAAAARTAAAVRVVLVAAIALAGRAAGKREPRRLGGQPSPVTQLPYRGASVPAGNERDRVPLRALGQRANARFWFAPPPSALRFRGQAHGAPPDSRLSIRGKTIPGASVRRPYVSCAIEAGRGFAPEVNSARFHVPNVRQVSDQGRGFLCLCEDILAGLRHVPCENVEHVIAVATGFVTIRASGQNPDPGAAAWAKKSKHEFPKSSGTLASATC
jgi:hypothetical protein